MNRNSISVFLAVLTMFFGFEGCLPIGGGTSHRITFIVIAPKTTPNLSTVYLTGNTELLGMWNPRGLEMKRINDSTWQAMLAFPHNERIEYKLTRGDWSTEALYANLTIPPNFVMTVSADTTVTIRPRDWKDFGLVPVGGITGTVHYHKSIIGAGLKSPRDIIVWLPPFYDSLTTKRYPVLYMHDAQNIIDPRTSTLGYDWRADEVADSLIRNSAIDELIIVGLNNTKDRTEEYSGTDLGHAYAQLVVSTVKPFIDSAYRTIPDQEHTAVMGSSMGGLISFLFAWWYPDVFSMAGCISPAFGFDDGNILQEVKDYAGPKKPIRIFIDNGGIGLEQRLQPGVDRMIALLQQQGYHQGTDFDVYIDPTAEHNEKAWAHRLWRPLIFFFKTRQ